MSNMYILKKNKILVVTYSFSPGKLAQSERAYYLVKSLVENGNKVTVLTCKSEEYFFFENNVKIITFELKDLFMKYKYLNRLFSPIPDGYYLAMASICSSIKVEDDIDIIISTSPPHSIHHISRYLSNKLKSKLIIDLRDAWKDNPLVNYGTLIHKKISNIFYSKYLNGSDLIIANTDDLKEKILSHNIKTKIITIPNGYPRDSFNNLKEISFFPDIKNKFLYSGGTYGGKAVKVIQSLINKSNYYDLKVGFLGEKFEDSNNCIYLGTVNSEDVPSYLLSSDYLVLYLPKTEVGSARILLKAYGYAKSGKPILYIGPINATYYFLKSHSNIFLVDEDNADEFNKQITLITTRKVKYSLNVKDFSFENNFSALFK